MNTLWAIAIGLLIVWQTLRYAFYRPPNFPPGPPRIPLFGSYLILLALNYDKLHLAIMRLSQFYRSSIVGFHYGPVPVVVCNDLKSSREALRNPALDGKPDVVLTRLRSPDYKTHGVFFTQGPVWQANRRFALRHMRDFGYGRRQLAFELDVRSEIESLLDMCTNGPRYEHERSIVRPGGFVLAPQMFAAVTGNAVLRALCNETLQADEQRALFECSAHAIEFGLSTDAFAKMFSILPFLPSMCPDWCGYTRSLRSSQGLYAFVERIVRAQYERFEEANAEGEERNFVEFYFSRMRSCKSDEDRKSFNMEQLIMTCVDFVLPTFSTISAVMSSFMQVWIRQPEVLAKIQREIDNVVGGGRLPTLDDRIALPYTEAALREQLRLHTTLPLGFPHQALEATTLAGYTIPRGAIVFTGLQAAHWDETEFTNARTFRAERFLHADSGRLDVRLDRSLPFAAGRRLCAGETFSRNLLFMLTATLAQQFDVRAADERQAAHIRSGADSSRSGIVSVPREAWLVLQRRHGTTERRAK